MNSTQGTRPRLLAVLLVGVLALVVTGCDLSSSGKKKGKKRSRGKAAPTSVLKKGAKKLADPNGGQVTRVGKQFLIKPDADSKAIVSLDSYRVLGPGVNETFPPDSGAFTVFNVRLKALKGTVHYNPLYLKLKTPDGKLLDPNDGNANYLDIEPDLPPMDLLPGKTISTSIALDAKARPGTRVIYTSSLNQVVALWRL
ncbi:hypothetical protein [Spirillospora sp. CA-294931]|uniref:hypothetical protein n=1 Tax=Spirillospora sp. CA-294931 TaxID=3240042 RepID=UPI003D8C49C6